MSCNTCANQSSAALGAVGVPASQTQAAWANPNRCPKCGAFVSLGQPCKRCAGSSSSDPVDVRLTFGKHSGKTISDVLDTDRGYVAWLASDAYDPAVRNAARKALEDAGPIVVSPDEAAAVQLTFGKHEGETLGDVFRDDPNYVDWLTREARDPGIREAAQKVAGISVSDQVSPDEAIAVHLTFGEHEGETLGYVFRNDPDYVDWLAREARNPRVQSAAKSIIENSPPIVWDNLSETEKLALRHPGLVKPDTLRGANLRGVDLQGVHWTECDLVGTDLTGANLSGADLSNAHLNDAILGGANLCDANLADANLSGAIAVGADLQGVDLSYANLSGVDLSRANLSNADLFGANLSNASLSGANLQRARLVAAEMEGTNLDGANLTGAEQ